MDLRTRPPVRAPFLVCAVIAIALYFECPFRVSVVWGDSMAPTLHDGQICLLQRDYYRHHPVVKGDIVAVRVGQEIYTKRIFGAPGDALTLISYPEDGTYEIPFPAQEARMRRPAARPRTPYSARLITLAVPPDKCFLVGDNRPASYDSRCFGLVDQGDVLGKVVTPAGR
jgi:signal peptidase I